MFGKIRNLISQKRTTFGILSIFVALMLIFLMVSPNTWTSTDIYSSTLEVLPEWGIIAMGLTILLIGGEIDLSFASVFGFTATIVALAYSTTGSLLISVVAGLGSGVFMGFANGFLSLWFGINSLIVTLGMSLVWRGLMLVSCGGLPLEFSIGNKAFKTVLVGSIGGFPVQMFWFLAIGGLLWILLEKSKFGNWVYTTGDKASSARAMGVNTFRTKLFSFMLLGLLSAIGGLICLTRLGGSYPTFGEGRMLEVFAMSVIGGTALGGGRGSIPGTIVGIFIIMFLDAGVLTLGFSSYWVRIMIGGIIVISMITHSRIVELG